MPTLKTLAILITGLVSASSLINASHATAKASEVMQKSQSQDDENQKAHSFVSSTSKQVIEILNSHLSDFEKSKRLTDLFLEVTDVDWMGKFAIGRYWQQMDDQSKISYLETYRSFLIASYVPKFKKYNGQKIEIKNIKPTGDDQYIVQTDLNLDGPNSAPYNVDYRIKYVSGKFKIRDIIAEGVSMMTTQRSDFSSIVSSSGIEALRQELIKKSESSGS